MTRAEVLERNLTRLLQKAYQPVRPRASFRARLQADFLAGAARFEQAPAAEVSPPGRRRWLRQPSFWLAAAAAVLLLALGPWWERSPPGAELEQLLARGELALRVDPTAVWTGSSADALDYQGGFLEVVTPAERGVRIDAVADRLELDPVSRLVLAADPSERGVRVRVAGGRALVKAQASPGERWLGAGEELLLRSGLTAVSELPEELPALPSTGRQPVAAQASSALPQEAETGTPEPASASVQVQGTVALAGDETHARRPAESFQLVFLRQVALPQVSEPLHFEFTSSAGRFELGGLEPGSYQVFARTPGRAPWHGGTVAVEPAGAGVLELEIELIPGRRIEGLVVDAETGLPIADALVVSETDAPVQVLSLTAEEYLDRPGVLTLVRSGPDGSFVLEDSSDRPHVVRASAAGHAPAWEGPRDPADGPFRLALSAAGRIEGQVLDSAGAPVQGSLLIVSLSDFGPGHPIMSFAQALTDSAGRYVLDDLPAGSWPLLSFGAREGEALEPEMAFVRVLAGQVTRHDFAAEPSGVRLEGLLTQADGTPAAERAVWLTPAQWGGRDMVSTSTDAAGRFRFEGLAARSYAVFTSRGAPPDMVLLGNLDLSSGADVLDYRVQLSGGGLAGQVLAGLEGGPLENVVLVLLRQDAGRREFAGKTFTTADGHFEFEHVDQGLYELLIIPTRQVYGSERADGLELRPGQRLDLGALRLYPGGALELTVTGPDGRPAVGVAVSLRFEDGQVYDLLEDEHTGSNGRLLVPALKTGRWLLELRGGGFAPRDVSVDVTLSEQPSAVAVELAQS